MPHSRSKIPKVSRENGMSLKTVKSGKMLPKLGRGFRGSLLRTNVLQMTSRNMSMKPMIRADQAKPTIGNSRWSINGKMIPPIPPAVMAIPVALPRFFKKK